MTSSKSSKDRNETESVPAGAVTRRQFLEIAAGAVISTQLSTGFAESANDVPYRTLGRTGEKVSMVGLGGNHLGKPVVSEDESIRIIRTAIDNGINFLDNCWDYNDGQSEIRMGEALRDGYRQRVFLMTKIDGQEKKTAARQIEESLKRLQTDRIDLLQFHEIIRMDDPARIFAVGGGMEAAIAAKEAGKIRYIGFTGHKSPDIHLKMLETAANHKFRFDTVQMPLNVMDAHFRSFGHQVLPVLVHEGIAALGMKCFGDHDILDSKTVKPIECLHYCLNLPIAVQITGIDSQVVLDQAFEAVRTFKPMPAAQVASLLERTRTAAADGKYEPFKTTARNDGTARNPSWLG